VPTVEQAIEAMTRYAEELQDVTHQLQAEVCRRKEASDE
jgi:hypothetical protein